MSQLQAILEYIHDAVLILDTGGAVQLASRRLKPLLGVDTKSLHNRNLHTLLDDPNLAVQLGFNDESTQLLLAALDGNRLTESSRVYKLETPYERVIQRKIIPVEESVLMVFRDQTEVHELRRMQDDITSMIVHDLRSPLTAITASMRLLKDTADPGDSFGKLVLETTDIASRAARKLLILVNSLLDVSKMENGINDLEREPTELKTIIITVVDELTPLSKEMDVNIQLVGTDFLPLLDVDPDKIERLLYNLMDNAIKFTPAGGTVTLQVNAFDPNLMQQGMIRINIADTGEGIPPQDREHIFDRYQQRTEGLARRRGTGLGLTFCKLTVESHGGRIWVEENPAGGSIFAFTLPLADTSSID